MGAKKVYLDAPSPNDFEDRAEFTRAYSRWYYHNVTKGKTKKAKDRPKGIRPLGAIPRNSFEDMEYGSVDGGKASAKLTRMDAKGVANWQKISKAAEDEIASRIEVIELPESMSAEEYEKVVFSD